MLRSTPYLPLLLAISLAACAERSADSVDSANLKPMPDMASGRPPTEATADAANTDQSQGVPPTVHARPGTSLCPEEIATTQNGVAPAGYLAAVDQRQHKLAGVIFYVGKPEKDIEVPPANVQEVRPGVSALTYDLSSVSDEVWIECGYTFTSVVLRTRIIGDIHKCEATTSNFSTYVDLVRCE